MEWVADSEVLAEAEDFVLRMPTAQAGLLFLKDGQVVQRDPSRLEQYQTHAAPRRGHGLAASRSPRPCWTATKNLLRHSDASPLRSSFRRFELRHKTRWHAAQNGKQMWVELWA
jgi:hypothetical protein